MLRLHPKLWQGTRLNITAMSGQERLSPCPGFWASTSSSCQPKAEVSLMGWIKQSGQLMMMGPGDLRREDRDEMDYQALFLVPSGNFCSLTDSCLVSGGSPRQVQCDYLALWYGKSQARARRPFPGLQRGRLQPCSIDTSSIEAPCHGRGPCVLNFCLAS